MADYRGIDIKEYAENGLADVAGLLSRREYSLSIVRARQIEERLIRSYAAERNIEYTTLADTIEQLYSGGFINMASRDAYHTIRLYGNKVVHEAAESEEDAQNAYYLLKNEVQTYLSRKDVSIDRTPVRVERNSQRSVREEGPYRNAYSSEREDGGRYDDMSRRSSSQEAPRRTQRDRYDRDERGGRNQRRERSPKDGRRREREFADEERSGISIYDILRVLIPVVVVILIVIIIRSLLPSKTAVPETTSAVETTVEETTVEETTETESETEPETTTEAETEPVVQYKIIDDGTNVRYADNQERIYTQLPSGTVIGAVTPVDGTDFVQFTLDGVSVVVRKDLITPAE